MTYKERKRQNVQIIYSSIMYVISFVLLWFPWVEVGDKKYNLFQLAREIKSLGLQCFLDSHGLVIDKIDILRVGLKFNLVCYLVVFIIGIIYLITVFLRKRILLNLLNAFMAVVLAYAAVTEYMMSSIVANYEKMMLFTFAIGGVFMLECVGRFVIEIWDETTMQTAKYEKKASEERRERKERLYFPGKYSQLFYLVSWKNFRNNLKDYLVLLLCNTIVFAFVLSGMGLEALLGKANEAREIGRIVGAGKILFESILALGVVGVFMLVLLLIYYLRQRIPEYGVFRTLGIREKTLYISLGVELGIGACVSLITGGILGYALIWIFKNNMAGIGKIDIPTIHIFTVIMILKAVGIMLLIYLVTFFVTHDLIAGFRMGSMTNLQMIKEWMPKKWNTILAGAGAALSLLVILQYAQISNFESVKLLIVCFAGLYVLIRFGIAGFMTHWRKSKGHLSKLLVYHPFFHKSRTTTWYILGVTVIQICILAIFSVQLAGVSLVKDVDALFPYDMVCITSDENEEDENFIGKLREEYGFEVNEFPMVRVVGTDSTEKSEGPGMPMVYPQNIGISESTFHTLKKMLDPSYEPKDLGLDADGKKIYIVHQQDKSVKGQPIDFKSRRTTPKLYTGPVCTYVDPYSHRTSFVHRKIVGEEIGSLIGAFCRGERENLVVFSDEYFEKAKDIWKVTNMNTGELIDDPAERVEGITIRQGPTKLVLVQGDVVHEDGLEQDIDALKERHKEEEHYDALVKNVYFKESAIEHIEAECYMKETMAKLLIAAFFLAGIILIGLKMMTERKMNKRRMEFLECMGMHKKDRNGLVIFEYNMYLLISVVTSVITSVLLIVSTIHARFYTKEDIVLFIRKIIPFAACEMIIYAVFVEIMILIYLKLIDVKRQ